jgi:hypothetical protein
VALGRAIVVNHALIANDTALAHEVVTSVAASADIKITPEVRAILACIGLRVLRDVLRDEAGREVGRHKAAPEMDASLAVICLSTTAPLVPRSTR